MPNGILACIGVLQAGLSFVPIIRKQTARIYPLGKWNLRCLLEFRLKSIRFVWPRIESRLPAQPQTIGNRVLFAKSAEFQRLELPEIDSLEGSGKKTE